MLSVPVLRDSRFDGSWALDLSSLTLSGGCQTSCISWEGGSSRFSNDRCYLGMRARYRIRGLDSHRLLARSGGRNLVHFRSGSSWPYGWWTRALLRTRPRALMRLRKPEDSPSRGRGGALEALRHVRSQKQPVARHQQARVVVLAKAFS